MYFNLYFSHNIDEMEVNLAETRERNLSQTEMEKTFKRSLYQLGLGMVDDPDGMDQRKRNLNEIFKYQRTGSFGRSTSLGSDIL